MNNNKSDESRRKLLKSIVAGSGAVIAGKNLPESWSRPVVESVMLPAHAQTSSITHFGSFTLTPPQGSLLDVFVKPVYATHLEGIVTVELCIERANGTAQIEALTRATGARGGTTNVSRWEGNIPIDGTSYGLTRTEELCNSDGDETRNLTFQVSVDAGGNGNCTGRVDGTWDITDDYPSGSTYNIGLSDCGFTLTGPCVMFI